ncbi:MAG: hypothetical protein U1F77_14990 [Kiritimatiellia bacterium]
MFLLLTAVFSGCRTAGPDDDPRALREYADRVTEAMIKMEEAQMKRDVEHVESVPVRLLQLSPEFKARLHLHLLDFRQPPPHHAEQMARADIESGHLNILTGGMNIYHKRLRAFLQSEYQIEVMNIADCDDGEAIFRLIDCYNAIVQAEVTKRTGKPYEDILREYTAKKSRASSDQSEETP